MRSKNEKIDINALNLYENDMEEITRWYLRAITKNNVS